MKNKKRPKKNTKAKTPANSAKKPRRSQESLVEFLRRSPLYGAKLDLTRQDDYGRDIDL